MSSVGSMLSDYRRRQRVSQQALALGAAVSARHISFIETGRAQPSRAMLLRLADVLEMPAQDTNLLLHAGGFAPAFPRRDLQCAEMAIVRDALRHMLAAHEPFPAQVLDGAWNILMVNGAQQALIDAARDGREPPSHNLLELVMHPAGYRPLLGNWELVAGHLLRRLRRQVQAYGRDEHRRLLSLLLAMDPPARWQQPEAQGDLPMLTVDLLLPTAQLRLFSTLSQFGTALDAGLEELVIESYFPADETTRSYFLDAAGTRSQ